jgi:lysophospholipase L1-like esterase
MWIVLLAPLPWIVLRFAPRRRGAAERDVGPSSARAVLERGLRSRTGIDVAAHTTPGALAAALRLEGVTPETALAAEQLRDACDAQAFARGERRDTAQAAHERAESVLALIEKEARRRVLPLMVLVAVLAGGCAGVDPGADGGDVGVGERGLLVGHLRDVVVHAEDGLHPSADMHRLWAQALLCTGKFGKL